MEERTNWLCPNCRKWLASDCNVCPRCRIDRLGESPATEMKEPPATESGNYLAPSVPQSSDVIGFVSCGSIAGAILGFLLRPSLPLFGQLPFGIVLTRGENLSGMDVLLKSTAEQSFNYVLMGASFGVLLALGGRAMFQNNNSVPEYTATSLSPQREAIPETQLTSNPFCTQCGAILAEDIVYCGKCGKKRS